MTPEQFKSMRTALGFTQATLAKALDVAALTVIRYEKGQRPIPDGVVQRLAALQPQAKASKHKVYFPGYIAPSTHPELYDGSPRKNHGLGYYQRRPEHPCVLMPSFPWPVLEEVPQAPVWVLDHPKYLEALAGRRAAPPAPKLSDEDFAAKAAAGASMDELFRK